MSRKQVLREYRTILRYLRKWPSTKQHDSSARTHVIQQFRDNKSVADAALKKNLRAQAHAYAVMVTGIEEQKHLWFLESGEKFSQQERIARTANLVGLGLPQAEPDQKT